MEMQIYESLYISLSQLLMEMRERVRDLEIGKLFYPSP